MGDEDHGGALLPGGGDEKLHDLLAGQRVQRSGRLVGEEDLGPGYQAPSQGDPLGLAARQLPGSAPLQPVEAERLEPGSGLVERLGSASSTEQQGEGHVFFRRQLGDKLAELEHEPEVVPAQAAARLLAHGVDAPAGKEDLAPVGLEDAGQAVQQGGLARAARAHDRQDLSCGDRQAGASQRGRGTEGELHVPGLQNGPFRRRHLGQMGRCSRPDRRGQRVQTGRRQIDPAKIGFEVEQPVVRQQRVDRRARPLQLGQLPHALQVGAPLDVQVVLGRAPQHQAPAPPSRTERSGDEVPVLSV